MRAGRLVEVGEPQTLLSNPSSSYTKELLASIPSLDPGHPRLVLTGKTNEAYPAGLDPAG
jgi:peptide/nickel transport system ATP-binding protein